MDKKKKIIIAVVAVVLIVAAGVAIYFAVSKDDNNYVDVPVTEAVTDENGETVTDATGQPVTQVVTQPNGTPQTTKKSQNNTSNNITNGGNQGGDNQGNSGNNGGNSNNGSNSDSNKPDEEKPEDKPAKNRKIKITAVLPQNCDKSDIMEIWVNGEKDSEITVSDYLAGNSRVEVTTDKSYKDEVTVEVVLQKYKTKAKGTVLNNHEDIRIDIPLNGVENFTGEDD